MLCRESLRPTPRVSIKMAMTPSKLYKTLPYLPYLACPDTGASCNVVSEREARRMHLSWTKTRVSLTNASNTQMRAVGEAEVYCAAENGSIKKIRVIISPDLADRMLLRWQAQMTLGEISSDLYRASRCDGEKSTFSRC